jgi:flagellar basal body P-ring formation protein FlgA
MTVKRTLSALVATAIMAASFGAAAIAAPAQSTHGKSVPQASPAPTLALAPPRVQLPSLKNDITMTGEVITFGDLVTGLDEASASLPAFRSPALGETGTIQVQRILESARINGLPEFTTGHAAQVIVTRMARRINSSEIELALKKAIEERHGVDARALALMFDNGAPSLAVEPDMTQQMVVQDLSYDQRVRRVTAILTMPGSAATRLKPVRVTGQFVETLEVVLPTRPVTKGETLASSDVTLERRPREGLGTDTLGDLQSAIGKVVKRAVMPGQPLRSTDVARQEIVGRGDIVTMMFEAPGLVVSMRGKANEAGAAGDVISVQNLQSKRVLQATISGPGRVTVNSNSSNRVATAD